MPASCNTDIFSQSLDNHSWLRRFYHYFSDNLLLKNKILKREIAICSKRKTKVQHVFYPGFGIGQLLTLFYNNQKYIAKITEPMDELLKSMGLENAMVAKISEVKAPMPGLIYQLPVKVGDAVAKGDVLLVLVAMKMENAIKAQGEGVVKAIHVNLNDSVEKNQVLISFA